MRSLQMGTSRRLNRHLITRKVLWSKRFFNLCSSMVYKTKFEECVSHDFAPGTSRRPDIEL